ncbi:MAG: hypothetical protein H0X65_17765, partial [Gemmatimonadetes bacterium]|nr:hypothetical protein [Gemmatimonadota bacterium]
MATSRQATDPAEGWLGEQDKGFNGGDLWIGRHSVDGDVLVFDPTETDPTASNL